MAGALAYAAYVDYFGMRRPPRGIDKYIPRQTVLMLKRMLPDTWWCRCLWIAATYIVAANLLPNALLILVNCAGYLPYSDRPGPGWQLPHLPTLGEMRFFVGFAFLLLPATAIYGLIFAAAGFALGFCLLPRWGLLVRRRIRGRRMRSTLGFVHISRISPQNESCSADRLQDSGAGRNVRRKHVLASKASSAMMQAYIFRGLTAATSDRRSPEQ